MLVVWELYKGKLDTEFCITYLTWNLQLYRVVPEHLDRGQNKKTHDPSYTVYKVCHETCFRRKVNGGRKYPRLLLKGIKYWKTV